MKPFLKWAGSKYKIVNRILTTLPKGKRLIEPFAGSAAVFLNADFENNLISDTNGDLIRLFQIIQANGLEFIDYAESFFKPENNDADRYYEFRQTFNDVVDVELKSALFIYLNRHCFNGLCRYNSSGKFNVPFGRYNKPAFPKKELLEFFRKSKFAQFFIQDFKISMKNATEGDVVYCDPPYAPLTVTSNFSDYTQDGFSLDNQNELATLAETLCSRGIFVAISNHNTSYTRDIYKDAKLTFFDVQRFISSQATNRTKAAELIASYV